MTIAPMRQPEAIEIADRWKYPGEYAFYDMTADPEDYEEIVTPEKRGDRYFSVFSGNELTGFFSRLYTLMARWLKEATCRRMVSQA